jgi:hypothetical protein
MSLLSERLFIVIINIIYKS